MYPGERFRGLHIDSAAIPRLGLPPEEGAGTEGTGGSESNYDKNSRGGCKGCLGEVNSQCTG